MVHLTLQAHLVHIPIGITTRTQPDEILRHLEGRRSRHRNVRSYRSGLEDPEQSALGDDACAAKRALARAIHDQVGAGPTHSEMSERERDEQRAQQWKAITTHPQSTIAMFASSS